MAGGRRMAPLRELGFGLGICDGGWEARALGNDGKPLTGSPAQQISRAGRTAAERPRDRGDVDYIGNCHRRWRALAECDPQRSVRRQADAIICGPVGWEAVMKWFSHRLHNSSQQ